MAKAKGEKLIADNRRARHDYNLLDRYEAGLVLTGTEVKSLREGKTSLQQAYAEVREGEAWLVGVHIAEYGQGNRANHDPDRPRKLLLHRREIDRLYGQVREKGFTVVPTRLYFKDGRVKVELALARGKELHDKRRDIADRDARREMERQLKSVQALTYARRQAAPRRLRRKEGLWGTSRSRSTESSTSSSSSRASCWSTCSASASG